jgi:hypothetical protein
MTDVEITMTDFEKGMCLLGLGKIHTDLDFRRPGANSEALAWNTFIRLKLNYPQLVMRMVADAGDPANSLFETVKSLGRNPGSLLSDLEKSSSTLKARMIELKIK